MRRQNSVASLLYNHLYPRPLSSDPPNFSIHLARNLIPEIRVETAHFYGSLDSIEARYPGLNYCHPPHRMRLSRFPHHARLFKAIDDLGLTEHEVLDLVRWEGTLWARARFERDENITVRDTTGDGIGPWVDRRAKDKTPVVAVVEVPVSRAGENAVAQRDVVERILEQEVDEDEDMSDEEQEREDAEDDDDEEDEDESDRIMSIGNDLNRRLMAAVTARDAGQNAELDPEFEQYLKEQIESGSLRDLILASMQRRRQQAQAAQTQQTAAVYTGEQSRQGTAAA